MDKTNVSILIVNKSQMLRAIIRDTLRKAGYMNLSSTGDGATSLRQAKAKPPDLVIVDYFLPDMTGTDLLREIRKSYNTRNVAVIMISAEPEKLKVAQAAEEKVNAYVVKPFAQQTLLDKVKRVLDQQMNPSEGRAFYLEANELLLDGDVDGALAKYKQALNATQYAMSAVYYKIGQALEFQEKIPHAETNYGAAVDRSDRYVDAYDALAMLKLKGRNADDALHFLKRALIISPLNANRQRLLAEALLEKGENEEAEAAYRKSLEIDPSQSHIYNRLGIALRRQGKLEEAQEYLLKALEASPEKDEHLHFNLAVIYLERGYKATAASHLEKALEINPDFQEARELHGKVGG